MTPIELECVVAEDLTKNYGEGELFYPPGGGAVRPKLENGEPDPADFNVRTLTLRPSGAPTGDFAANSWMIASGLALIGCGSPGASMAGKRLKITIEEVEAE